MFLWLINAVMIGNSNLFLLVQSKFSSGRLGRSFARWLVLAPIVFLSLTACSESNKKSKVLPATKEDIFLYRGLGASYICNARAAGIEFPKAAGIASATYVQVLNGRHGGIVKSAGKEKLSNKQLFSGAELQVVTGALQYCPKDVPNDVRERIEKLIKSQNSSS